MLRPLDESFPRNYEARWSELPPSGKRQFLIPPDGVGNTHAVRVEPSGREPWVGVFAGCDMALNGLFTTPDPDRLLVVVEGEGWLVEAATPSRYEQVHRSPVLHVRSLPASGLLVIGSFSELAAYSAEGFMWETDRIGFDELEITAVTPDAIHGTTPEFPGDDEVVPFSVDLRTGALTGGRFTGEWGVATRPSIASRIRSMRGRLRRR